MPERKERVETLNVLHETQCHNNWCLCVSELYARNKKKVMRSTNWNDDEKFRPLL